jgi:hypothetical protein
MAIKAEHWELTILDGDPPVASVSGLACLAVGDIDGDGHNEIVTGGNGAMLWYRPDTGQRGLINFGEFHVGLVIADVDGDGQLEIVAGRRVGTVEPQQWQLVWYKPGIRPTDLWQPFLIDEQCTGGPHDIAFVDIDGDNISEMVATACYSPIWGIFVYKRPADPTRPWPRYAVQQGTRGEGLAIGDLNGDGRLEIVCGPHVWYPPPGGALGGPWRRQTYAPSHREMCRVELLDVTGNGRLDIVCVDSEYFEGQLSWFENRPGDVGPDWLEHRLERPLVYAHSLSCRREGAKAIIFVGEMAGGGWNAPYNHDAKLLQFTTADGGHSWQREVLYQGQGTHQAILFDLDRDGQLEVVGKEWRIPRVQVWKKVATPSPMASYRHQFIDRDKPGPGTDILAVDITGDGKMDVACGRWWYEHNTWRRHELPGTAQVIHAFDVDGDGRQELIVTLRNSDGGDFSNRLAWLKPIDPVADRWQSCPIGRGTGDWPHGSCAGPLGPAGQMALVTAYHSAHAKGRGGPHYPEIWIVPSDPTRPWERKILAKVVYGEQLIPWNIAGSGRLDIFCGPWWLENHGDGTFTPHRMFEGLYPARLGVMDIAGNGRPDLIVGDETVDWSNRTSKHTPLCWYECPADPRQPWIRHAIDKVRCPHSIGVADLDGDGETEIICGEHDPFTPYRQRCKLYVYKKADPAGRAWKRWTLDDRFEHHDGGIPIDLGGGRIGILSHGWKDDLYVHLWAPAP